MYKERIFSLLIHIPILPGIIFILQVKKTKLAEGKWCLYKGARPGDAGTGIQNRSCLFPKLLGFSPSLIPSLFSVPVLF